MFLIVVSLCVASCFNMGIQTASGSGARTHDLIYAHTCIVCITHIRQRHTLFLPRVTLTICSTVTPFIHHTIPFHTLDPLLEPPPCVFQAPWHVARPDQTRCACVLHGRVGADTHTASYDKEKHVSRDGADIPLVGQEGPTRCGRATHSAAC